MKRFLFPILSLLILVGCTDPQKKYKNRLEGTWNIAEETITLINPDGTTELLSTSTDVGTLLLEESEFEGGIFLDYTITLNNNSYSWVRLPFKTDEQRTRVFFYYFYCEELFGCDMIATVEADKANEQMWSFYRRTSPTSGTGTAHRKTTWVLKRI